MCVYINWRKNLDILSYVSRGDLAIVYVKFELASLYRVVWKACARWDGVIWYGLGRWDIGQWGFQVTTESYLNTSYIHFEPEFVLEYGY